MMRSPPSWPFLLVLLTAFFAAACSAPTRTEVSLEPGTASEQAGRGGVVLFPGTREQANPGEAAFIQCLTKEFSRRVSSEFRVMDTAAFQDALFPWFEAEKAPRTVEELNRLLARPQVRERITALRVRYLLVIASAESSDGFPGMICGGGYGGAGCLGLFWEDKTYRARAVIWDMAQGIESGSLAATSMGKSVGFALGIPILFIADTQEGACHVLAAELARLLSTAAEAGSTGK